MIDSGSHELMAMADLERQLAEATDLDQVVGIRDKAAALELLVKAAGQGLEIQNRVVGMRLRVERKLGRFLADLPLRGGNRRSMAQEPTLSLAELGISRGKSKRWQLQASVPDDEFERYLRTANEEGRELTAVGLQRIGRKLCAADGKGATSKTKARARQQKHPNTNGHVESCGAGCVDESLAGVCAAVAELTQAAAELENHRQTTVRMLSKPDVGSPLEADSKRAAGTQQRAVARYAQSMRQSLSEVQQRAHVAAERLDTYLAGARDR